MPPWRPFRSHSERRGPESTHRHRSLAEEFVCWFACLLFVLFSVTKHRFFFLRHNYLLTTEGKRLSQRLL